jgi:hypothetical protein
MDDTASLLRLKEIEHRIALTKRRLEQLRALALKQAGAGRLREDRATAVLRSLERSLFVLEDIRAAVKAKLDDGLSG